MKTKPRFLNFTTFFLFFLILIAAFLRFFKLSEWFFLMIDEDLTAFLIKRMLIERKPLLVGFPFSGDFYTGPLFYYLAALIMIIFKMNPLGWAFFASLISVITVPLLYYVGKKIFKSPILGLFSAILYSFSYLVNIHNRIFNRLTIGPTLTLIVYYSFYKIIKKGQTNWVYPLILSLILAAQTGGCNLSLIFLALLIWFIYKLPLKNPKVLRAIGIFLLSHITILIFDLRHNFVASRALIKFFSFAHNSVFNPKNYLKVISLFPKTLARILFISGPNDLTKQVLPCEKYLKLISQELSPSLIIFSSFMIIFFILSLFFKKKHSFGLIITNLHLLVISFGLLIYRLFMPDPIYEWFFVVFFSGFCLITAYFLDFLWKKNMLNRMIVILFLLIFIYSNLKTTLQATSSYGFKMKNEAVLYAGQKVKGNNFYLESLGGCFRYGYRYLFWLHKHEPVVSYMDYLLAGWLYPKKEVKDKPKTGVIIVNWEDKEDTPGFMEKYQQYQQKTVQRKNFGQIEILIIMDESSQQI